MRVQHLYWVCRECNENKADIWPTPEDEESGSRFIDPCSPAGDHDLHWRTLPDGSLEWITRIGEYTIETLQLGMTFEKEVDPKDGYGPALLYSVARGAAF